MTTTHLLLGGNGVVGRETAGALLRRGLPVASVGRHPAATSGTRSITADLLDAGQVLRAAEGAEVLYLVAGLPYSSRIWAEQWPVIVASAIDAAIAQSALLVYFDNVYAYGRVSGPMTESTPIAPCSRKGAVRADARAALASAAEHRGLRHAIGVSADFYGPGASTSVLNRFALEPIAAGRPGTWLVNADLPHSLSFTPDLGEGLAVLGTAPEAVGGTWNLATAAPLTGREYLRLAGGPETRIRVMGAGTMRLGGLFSAEARESVEMAYQYSAPYVLDSSRFERTFGASPTPVAEGIAATMEAIRTSP